MAILVEPRENQCMRLFMGSDLQTLKAQAYQAFGDGDFASALHLLEQVKQSAGLHAELANDLAVVQYRLGDAQTALKLFREALAMQGESQHLVANNLLEILEEQHALISQLAPSTATPDCVSAPQAIAQPAYNCPVCKQAEVSFVAIPEFYRENARRYGFVHYGQGEMTAHDTYTCKRCGASDRERLYVYWMEQEIAAGRLCKGAQVMHFAPEQAMSRVIRASQFFDYATADLSMPGVDHQVDLMDTPFGDGAFDFFICSHVLEHVADDGTAIRELRRITRDGGCGILMAPIIVGIEHTLEDPSVTDEAGRWRLYGQNDHVRLYAHDDYVRKIEDNGFGVDQYGIDYFGSEVYAAMGLKPSSILYIARA
ncbi:methyltransferase domain-containing protein [Pseudomonas sp. MMS21-TM103]|uniref:methyltransferase domain-containing protein n=1 Tax=Pseudomonas sp. MMS21 TM103 TaxID=2886506 RepID=UPI001EE113B8|nr:methyltransferase domain-containing protein [Pseudomonas sp. MMS21 TM103]MCG4453716.1 methyltransferase domain-containing protein [Pseudomonas sp. MMS21 TM103]